MRSVPIPTPPTDDIYKYFAISGLWLTFAFSILIAFVGYLSYAMSDHATLVARIGTLESFSRKVERRISSIKAGDLQENELKLSQGRNPEEELAFLRHYKSFIKPQIASMKKKAQSRHPAISFYWLERVHTKWWLPSGFAFSFVMMLIGFARWRTRQQLVDYSFKVDIKIKEQQLRLLKLERLNSTLNRKGKGWSAGTGLECNVAINTRVQDPLAIDSRFSLPEHKK